MGIFHGTEAGRRGFIRNIGLALLTMQILPSVAQASDGVPEADDPAKSLIIRSGQGFVPHTHDLWIPLALLKAPPAEGATLTSTKSRGHTHPVVLSHDQLAEVNRGGTVSVLGGSHTFVIALAQAVSPPAVDAPTQGGGA